jgi:hypothetical protein
VHVERATMKLDQIGFCAEIMLEMVKKYTHAYTSIMKNQTWCKGYVYIDAFAGAGKHISSQTGPCSYKLTPEEIAIVEEKK